MLNFDPGRAPAPPRDAATVVVLRDHCDGVEAFCVLRHQKSGFLGGALVFPGGKLDPEDASPAWEAMTASPHARADRFATPSASARALAIGACRETFEEGAILAATTALDQASITALRAELGATSFRDALRARSLRLALDGLVPWARWITPEAESRRFDARFYLLRLPPGQVGRHDDHETTHSLWATPKVLLDRADKGEIFLAPPTHRTLELLAAARAVTDAFAIAERQSLEPICPRFVAAPEPYLALPGDPSHEIRERRVEGPTRFVLRDGRFVSEEPTPAQEGALP